MPSVAMMNPKNISMKKLSPLFASVALLTLVGAGCGSTPAPANDQTSQTTPSQKAPKPGAAMSNCDTPYFPVRKGHSISYQSTIAGKKVSYSSTITDATKDSATLEYEFGAGSASTSKITVQMTCADGHLRALGQADFSSLLGQNTQFTSETKNTSGDLLPKDLAVGSEWSGSFESEATINNPQMIKMGMGKMEIASDLTHKAVAEEQVTVPAGTYTAIKVETTTKITTTMSANAKPAMTTTQTTEWWVKDVGLVKTVAGSGTSQYTTEAVSVTN